MKATIIRKINALLLLALFVFVHGVKAFHYHEAPADTSLSVEKVSAANDCPICDFHFAKEGIPATIAPIIFALKPYLIFSTVLPSLKPSSIGLSYADRGPPVF